MATKTVVCPECGAASAPGRYACAACAALLASVSGTPRRASAADPGDFDEVVPPHAPIRVDPEPSHGGTPDVAWAVAPAELAESADRAPAFEAGGVEPAAAALEADTSRPSELAFDEDAPLGSVTAIQDGVPPDWSDGAAPGDAAEDAPGAWPPVGDRGVAARPEPRTPAGSYLPPSAVLPPLDAAPRMAIAAPDVPSAAVERAGAATAWAGRSSAALADALDGIELTADGARRAVAIGAGIAALGMLLPWVNGLPAAGPFAGYVDRWGLAGPGMWLVLVALVALAAVAMSAGRPARWPVALPGVALAAFLGGLLWPYVLGGFGRSFGIWVVLIGAIVLAVGAVLDRRGRHGATDAGVPSGDEGR